MVDLCAAMNKAARENLQLKEPPKKKKLPPRTTTYNRRKTAGY